MDVQKLEDFLKEHGIEFRDEKWRMGDIVLDPKTIVKNEFFIHQTDFPPDEAVMYMKAKAQKKKVKIALPDLTTYTIGIFLDELSKPPKDRVYLDRTIPQMVVDPSLRTFPYNKEIPAQVFNESDLLSQYQNMMELGKDAWGNIKTTEVMFANYVRNQRIEQEKKIIAKIKHDPTKIEEADNFLGELYNLYRPAFVVFGDECRYDFEFFKAVIKHLVWNIKTKAWKGTNLYPFMLNLSGDQGNGKTSFIKHLCGDVLGELMSIQNIGVLNDSFGISILADQWVLFFDEMVKLGGNIDIEKLKQVITSNQLLTRVIFTKNQTTTKIRSVFIGSANRPIYEIINDQTGMRRYLNIEFRNDSIKNYKSLHTILDAEWAKHGLAIWQSVDESAPYGYLVGDLEKLWDTARTSYLSDSNSILIWMKAAKAETRTAQCSAGIKLEEAYALYKGYWEDKDKRQAVFNMDGFKKFIKTQYNTRLGKSYTPGELRIAIGVTQGPYMKSPEEEAGDFTTLPANLDRYKAFVPVNLGDGPHLTDFTTDNANAAANAQSAVSDQISPIIANHSVDIGNIGIVDGSYENSLPERAIRAFEGQQCQHRQSGDPAVNDFDMTTGEGPIDRDPTDEEIQWYEDNYKFLDIMEQDQPDAEVDDEAAQAALEYLREWSAQLKKKRAERKAELERLKQKADEEEEEFFRRLGETPNFPKVEIHDGEDVHSSGRVSHEEPAEYEADAKHDALVAAELTEAETKSDVEEDDFFQEIRRREGMQ